jgi:hypothetical protein
MVLGSKIVYDLFGLIKSDDLIDFLDSKILSTVCHHQFLNCLLGNITS